MLFTMFNLHSSVRLTMQRRELHWHQTAEWAYVLAGTMQITTVTPSGQNYIGTIVSNPLSCEGDTY